jgi:uncharacterized membrane protein
MIPDPLHPAMVHFPIALASLVPMFAILAAIAIRAGWISARAWLVVVLMQAMLAGSAWVAHETGENEEEKVEKVVDERFIEEHEEAADLLLWSAAITFAISLVGVAGGTVGTIGRAVSILAMFAVAGASVPAGKLGGELVYHHGAASAYVKTGEAAPVAPPQEAPAQEAPPQE